MIRFEWEPSKGRRNQRKHHISFDIAQRVFEDPDALSEQDRIEGGERRWQTLGMVDNVLLLLVAHTVEYENDRQDEVIRIISARRADRREKERYEEERQAKYNR